MQRAPQVRVTITPPSIQPGGVITIGISQAPHAAETRFVGFEVHEITPTESAWVLGASSKPSRRKDRLRVGLTQTESLRPGGLYELRKLDLATGAKPEQVVATLVGGRDYPRVFFEVIRARAKPRATREISLAAYELEERRRVDFARPLIAQFASTAAHDYQVIAFVKRCLITRPLRLPSVEIVPLSAGSPAMDDVQLINAVLAQHGWDRDIAPEAWGERSARENPMVIFHFPRVRADTFESAIDLAISYRDRALDVLSLHRGARGEPLAMTARDVSTGEVSLHGEFRSYRGNVMGGWLSGEDPAMLTAHIGAAESDGLAALFVALFRDAQATVQRDFAYFQFWALLETVARARLLGGQPVTDPAGAPLTEPGRTRPATTSSAPGRVYEMLKSRLASMQFAPNPFAIRPNETLWDQVNVWYGFRNFTAHNGGFRDGDATQSRERLYPLVKAASDHAKALSTVGPPDDPQSDAYLMALWQVCTLMVKWELALLSRPHVLGS